MISGFWLGWPYGDNNQDELLRRRSVEQPRGSPYIHVEFRFLTGYTGENIQKGELTCLELSGWV